MSAPRFTLDLRDISALLSRTALATSRRVLAAAITLVILMGIVTGVFARAYHDARRRGAEMEFDKGEAAANAGRPADALEHYRASLALERDNASYRRALVLALLGLRRTAEAETHLTQLLEHDPVDGEANLLIARLAASRGDFADTEAFYQRAIYGRWPAELSASRIAARFELIEWLMQMGARAPARAELLRLQAELPDVPFLQRELARRLLDLGQPLQAAGILRRELERRPSDASVARELARAEMAAGRLVEARDAARRALAQDQRDRRTRLLLDRLTEALSLDPTERGLTAAERFGRSQRLLAKARGELDTCLAGQADAQRQAPPADLSAVLANAQRLLDDEQATGNPVGGGTPVAEGKAAAETSEATSQPTPPVSRPPTAPTSLQGRADARLAAAEALWTARVSQCGAPDQALAWIFDRFTR